ncbi:Uncharacterized protein FKW44_023969 [Caligus rogercresseyi]|uniref:Uncharacterized protein n=1 Tax=Caligus rogercresseyi TaxID=217165 RepID=A0A7T8JUI7_CALRO|nr:Uncharacterized protein FKW44_023969 [Caligus rogercresseyi]
MDSAMMMRLRAVRKALKSLDLAGLIVPSRTPIIVNIWRIEINVGNGYLALQAPLELLLFFVPPIRHICGLMDATGYK